MVVASSDLFNFRTQAYAVHAAIACVLRAWGYRQLVDEWTQMEPRHAFYHVTNILADDCPHLERTQHILRHTPWHRESCERACSANNQTPDHVGKYVQEWFDDNRYHGQKTSDREMVSACIEACIANTLSMKRAAQFPRVTSLTTEHFRHINSLRDAFDNPLMYQYVGATY